MVQKSNRALSKLVTSKSEKVVPNSPEGKQGENRKKEVSSPKERGNNNAKRKEHFELEVQEHDIYPSIPGFLPELARLLKTVDSIRYEYIPPRYIKHINHQHYYLYLGSVVSGQLPATPLLNSSYDASFIAGILQLRYIYSMPVERIVKFFAESGFEMTKSTAHGLIKKTAQLFDVLEETLKAAILEDDYLHMDESYYTVLEKGPKSTTGKSSCKVYIWAALASRIKLVHFFYENGARARKVLTGYIKPDYQGAKRTALIYSLACSCRLNGINTFEYFKDLLNKFVLINPNTSKEYLRELLPDKYKK